MAFIYRNQNNKPETAPTPAPTGTESGLTPDWLPQQPTEEPAPVSGFFASQESVASPFDAIPAEPSSVATRNVLNSDVSVVGILRFTDDLLIDGSVEGEITSDGVLTVGANATIQAGEKSKVAVRTKSAIIHGQVTGDIEVTDRVELASTAQLTGNVKAAKISIQEGATFVGHCTVGAPASIPVPVTTKAGKSSSKGNANLLG